MARVKDNPFSYWIRGSAFDVWAEVSHLPVTEAKPQLVWVDLETTGLDANVEVTLQIGVILTDKFGRICRDGAADWLVFDTDNDSSRQKSWTSRLLGMEPFVRNMHRDSGLTRQIKQACMHPEKDRLHPAQVAVDMTDWLNMQFDQSEAPANIRERVPMSGSTPHFDRGFVTQDFPILDEFFHYRVGVDVSALREQAKLLNPSVIESQPVKREAHQPIPDLVDSIRLYRHLLQKFLVMDGINSQEFYA